MKKTLLMVALIAALSTTFAGCTPAKTSQKEVTQETATKNPEKSTSAQTYKDGTYTGKGQGYDGPITVAVTVQSGKISNIEVTDEDETDERFKPVLEQVPSRIIETQNTEVEAVSGSTLSSQGIMSAVEDALKTAK